MDINQIRTFLAVAQTGSFVGAADVVHVTQSTVSVRMRTLEDELRVHLFDRGKKGAVLTRAGQKFMRTASAMAQLWDQAKLDIGISEEQDTCVRIGGQVSLWQGYLVPWLGWMTDHMPGLAVRAQMADAQVLIQQLVDGALDMAVLYRPQYRPGFTARQIFTEDIMLVSSELSGGDPFGENYMLTYWGPEFQQDHALNFPEQTAPRLTTDLGTMAIDYLLERPATAFFPRRIAAPYIAAGRLKAIEAVPTFRYPAYAVYPHTLEEKISEPILAGMQEIASKLGLILSKRG